ncbi:MULTISPECIES: TetR/AcrR family transcriptional regulator [unclassified Rhodococcus (in: high G+C Gram-positive bacteria)]|uniref:TetR/AcrR family transcriptional regulator n=1 Tax=Rhodococcus sp. OK519 TaxID=2135729 RepID=UPI00085342BF|nr:TetR family transcriptional regulator [Prescottella equi]NKW46216.1 TetR family transcriptional regulator [Prescottella equi]
MNEEIRSRVVAAADALFYARGFGEVGMDAVRDAAGVSLRALYKEFPSKDELIVAVLAGRRDMWTRGVEAKVDAITDPVTRLLAVYDFLSDWFCDDDFRGCGFINAFGELGPSNPRVAEIVREHKTGFQRYVARLVADAGGPESLAPQLAILAEGAQTTAAIAGTTEPAAQARTAAEILIASALGR